jgi:hypothetical protein
MQIEIRRGRAGAPSARTLSEAANEWLDLAQRGVIRTLGRPLQTVRTPQLRRLARAHPRAWPPAPKRAYPQPPPGHRRPVHTNPTLKLALPAVRGRRDRVDRPQEAAALIAAAPPERQLAGKMSHVALDRAASAALARHHSPAFTLFTYVHLFPEDLPGAQVFDALIAPKGANKGATAPAEIEGDQAADAAA